MAKKPSIEVQIGARLFLLRKKKFSLRQFADKLGITSELQEQYELGEIRVPVKTLEKCAAILGVPVGFFFKPESPPDAD